MQMKNGSCYLLMRALQFGYCLSVELGDVVVEMRVAVVVGEWGVLQNKVALGVMVPQGEFGAELATNKCKLCVICSPRAGSK
jgi:hypothetical protein